MNIAKILGGTVGVLVIVGIVLGISYGIMYLIVSGIFWAFGPVIFGHTFSYKIVIGIWLVLILVNQVFKKSE